MSEFNDEESENINYSSNIIWKIINDEYIFPIETDYLNIKKQCVFGWIRNVIKIINSKGIVIIINSIKYIVYLKLWGCKVIDD